MKLFIYVFFLGGAAGVFAGAPRVVTIECDDLLRFSQTIIKVKAGEEITIQLKNTGKLPRLQHNFVLLKQGTNLALFGNEAMKAKDEDYIPPRMKDQIIAHTSMIAAGQTAAVTFTAPARGVYDYICSFPGHHSVSKGKLVVE